MINPVENTTLTRMTSKTQFSDPTEAYTVVTAAVIRELAEAAKDDLLLRARLCLHTNTEESIHEMVIAFRRGSYVPPHRHPGKTESYHLLEGEVEVVLFDEGGAVTTRFILSADDPTYPRLYRLRQPLWHTLLIKSTTAVLHETTNGPFRRDETELAPWAPSTAVECQRYLERLQGQPCCVQ